MCCTTQFINPICYPQRDTQRTSSVQYSGRAKSHQCQINKLVQCDSLVRFNKWIKTHILGLSTFKAQVRLSEGALCSFEGEI